ncbi:MAG: hypothetical protein QM747_02450 [Nocardioides sp.]
MHLHASFLPPPVLLQELTELVRAQEPPPPEPEAPEKRGLFGRRQEAPAAPVEAPGPLLDGVDGSELSVPITNFGFVHTATARTLVSAIAAATERYTPPRVVFAGGDALVDEDDRFVWAKLRSDDDDGVEVMRGIAREVVSAVEPMGLFCDRRMFRDRVPIATINDRTSAEHLEKVVAALDGYTSEPWTVTELSVLRRGIGPWQSVPIGKG